MDIRERVIEGVTVLEVRGRMVLPEELKLRESVRRTLARGGLEILIDLGGVRAIDSSGVGELLAAATNAHARRAELKICSVRETVLDLFHLVKLHEFFEIAANREAGVEAFRRERSQVAASA